MSDSHFHTPAGIPVPAITAEQMREVDRVAVEEFGLGILQMMENAGRNLALHVLDMLAARAPQDAPLPVHGENASPLIAILAGSGGNGGGGLCCARHLHNRGLEVRLILSKDPGQLAGAARAQLDILRAAGLHPVAPSRARAALSRARIVVDALIGYSLRGAPRGRAAELIQACNAHASRVLSLDLPSGLDATTGETPGAVVRPERTLTLALPKTGLRHLPGGPGHVPGGPGRVPGGPGRVPGDLYLADIGIPPEVYARLDIPYQPPFAERYWVRLER